MSDNSSGGTSGISCPSCGRELPLGRTSLCPFCKYPLILDNAQGRGEESAADLHKPSKAEDTEETVTTLGVTQPGPPEAAPVDPDLQECPACGHLNSPERTICERCATILTEPPQPVPLSPPPATPSRSPRPLALAAAVVVAALVLGGVTFWLARGENPPPPPPPPPASGKVMRLDPAKITVEASSVLPRDKLGSYPPERTLDGNVRTAWVSHGAKVGDGVGETLTYRFDEAVDLREIRLRNGVQKPGVGNDVNGRSGPYKRNGRVKEFSITTDEEKTVTWTVPNGLVDDLPEGLDWQSIEEQFGKTREVVLKVTDIYPSIKHKDLGISEIEFYAVESSSG